MRPGPASRRWWTGSPANWPRTSWRVVIGRCPESAGAPPAWAWVEALRALSAEIDPGPLAPALAPLLDETATTARESDASFGRFLLAGR